MKRTRILIIGIWLLLVMGNFFTYSQEEVPILKQVAVTVQYRQTMESMESLSKVFLDYIEHFNKAPVANSLSELMAQDCGNGMTVAEFFFDEIPQEQIPMKDIWQHEFYFKSKDQTYWIASAGSDGKFDGFDQIGVYPATEAGIKGKDIILSSKGYTYLPIEEKVVFFFINALFSYLVQL